jgi:alpha-L-rhamnosidase
VEALVSDLSVTALRCETKDNPLGIDILHPRLSWQCTAAAPDPLASLPASAFGDVLDDVLDDVLPDDLLADLPAVVLDDIFSADLPDDDLPGDDLPGDLPAPTALPSPRGLVQTAYQIVVAGSTAALDAGPYLWDTGKVLSADSLHHPYTGAPLTSRRQCFWRVRVWDGADRPSAWSETAAWEMGLLDAATEGFGPEASWIGVPWPEDTSRAQPCPYLRCEFTVPASESASASTATPGPATSSAAGFAPGPITSARLYITSLGLYAATLNGQPVTADLFTPGWTSYRHRLQYQTYDVTNLLTPGPNALGVILGDGWLRGHLGFVVARNTYGDRLGLLLRLEIRYADGSTQVIASDETWTAATGPILASDLYNGEVYDARRAEAGWDRPHFAAEGWQPVAVLHRPGAALVAEIGPPVRVVQERTTTLITRAPDGSVIYDFGQNLVGRVRLLVEGARGDEIVLHHAEVLDPGGELYRANLRTAQQEVRYILNGGEDGTAIEQYEPLFTFQGFRYVSIQGLRGEPTPDTLTALVIHSDMTPTGEFECSAPLLNQLQQNIVWGQKGNFLDVPTDCPQRDERLGWTGDAQVFARTACFNFDVAAFFTKWLGDLAADQRADGRVPFVVPDILFQDDARGAGAAAWSDAAVVVPFALYQAYSDTGILTQQFDSMVAWVEYMRHTGDDELLYNTGFQFGDWLALDHKDGNGKIGLTDTDLIGTAFYAHSAALLAEAAAAIGRTQEAVKYADLSAKIRRAFQREFVTPSGRLTSNTQTAYVLALMFDLLAEEQRPEAARRLVADIRRRGTQLTTGFVGTAYLCPVLSRFGYLDVAYDLLLREEYPSWLYPVTQGATTIWERWDGIRPDGSFQDPEMNSFNHYAYGAIGDWLYRTVAGLDTDPAAPGYRRAIVRPQPGGGLSWAYAALDTLLGEYSAGWSQHAGRMRVAVTVPPNGHAEVHLPHMQLDHVFESGLPLRDAPGCRHARQEGENVIVQIGSGDYRFEHIPE